MKINVISKVKNGIEKPINRKGCLEIDIELKDIDMVSNLKANRYIAVDGNCYRLTAKSYTEVKRKIA